MRKATLLVDVNSARQTLVPVKEASQKEAAATEPAWYATATAVVSKLEETIVKREREGEKNKNKVERGTRAAAVEKMECQ